MPYRVGEICERCHKHIHPQTLVASDFLHPLPACASCLPPGCILLTCGGCKLTRYCGKACQKAHRPVHRPHCEDHIRVKACARIYGPEIEAKYTSYNQWCENNSPAFAKAAFSALGIISPLDQHKAYGYILSILVETDSWKDDKSDKLKFTHSVLLATKRSRQAMHDMHDRSMGGPETVDRCILSPSASVVRIILQNISLPVLVNTYTVTWNIGRGCDLSCHKDPEWFEHLKTNVK